MFSANIFEVCLQPFLLIILLACVYLLVHHVCRENDTICVLKQQS